jgi:hypothetical protein
MNTEDILLEVNAERQRQEQLKESGKFLFSCADKGLSETEKFVILSEEMGEVSSEVSELVINLSKIMKFASDKPIAIENAVKEYRASVRKELIQVAAVCVAWVEALSSDD